MSEMDIRAIDEAVDEFGTGMIEPGTLDLEAPEADALEQRIALQEPERAPGDHFPFEVDEADAAEQLRVVAQDDDDYR